MNLLIEDLIIRFASADDLNSLRQHSHISIAVLERKIEWQEIIVAHQTDVLVGLLQLEYLWSQVPYIGLIKILPEYRRRGIGKRLLHFVETLLRERGHQTLYSSSQANEAEPQTWHRRVGFEECGIVTEINEGIGEIFFRKKL